MSQNFCLFRCPNLSVLKLRFLYGHVTGVCDGDAYRHRPTERRSFTGQRLNHLKRRLKAANSTMSRANTHPCNIEHDTDTSCMMAANVRLFITAADAVFSCAVSCLLRFVKCKLDTDTVAMSSSNATKGDELQSERRGNNK